MFFGPFFLLLLLSLVNCIKIKNSASKNSQLKSLKSLKSKPAAPAVKRSPPPPQMTQIVQEDFLVTPNDFEKDEHVGYLIKKLHQPQSILKFYTNAEKIYKDLPGIYKTIQGDAELAAKFLDMMRTLTRASLNEPLTVTNLVYAVGSHLQPLLNIKSEPIDELVKYIGQLQKDGDKKMSRMMTKFFLTFTLREVAQLQNFIKLISLATATKEKSKSGSYLDISKTLLEPYAKRIRLIIANALSKMIILLDIFVSDPSAYDLLIKIHTRLWDLHLRRLAAKAKIKLEDLDPKWKKEIMYRKFAITFTFDDWGPETINKEIISTLTKAAEDADKTDQSAVKTLNNSSSSSSNQTIWIVIACGSILLAALTAVFFLYRRNKSARLKGEVIDDQDNEIIVNLENNIE